MVDAVDGLHAHADAACAAPVWSLSEADLAAQVTAMQAVEAKVAAAKLALIREADGRDLGKRAGATSTTAWLKGDVTRMSPSAAHRSVKLAHALDTRITATRDALAAGAFSAEHAYVIDRAIKDLPADLDPAIVAAAEQTLIDYAARFHPDDLKQLGYTILETVAPDEADERLKRKLAADERNAALRRELRVRPDPEHVGGLLFRGKADAELAELLHTVLDQYARPRPTDAHTPDARTRPQRNGDALYEVLRQFLDQPDQPTRSGSRIQVLLTMNQRNFAANTGYGTYVRSHTPVSVTKVREHTCDSDVAYLWFDTQPGNLNAASRKRTFDGKLRRLLEARDRGCAFPGCDRPPAWCAGHHIKHWVDGGPTTLNNGVLLCGHHHTLIHHGQWIVRLGDDLLPEFIPPEYVDPHRTPIRNERWRI